MEWDKLELSSVQRERERERGKRKAWIVRERAAGAAGLVIINAGGGEGGKG